MRNRRHILDQLDVQASSLQRSDCTFTPRPRSLDPNFNVPHPKLGGLLRRLLSRTLTSKWRAFATPLKSRSTRGRPTKRISARIRNRHRRVIEGAVDVNNPTAYVPTNTLFLVCFCHRETCRIVLTDSKNLQSDCTPRDRTHTAADNKIHANQESPPGTRLSKQHRSRHQDTNPASNPIRAANSHGLVTTERSYRKSLTPFLPATVFRGPFRVRAFVLVRCPRTGRLARCRIPR